MNKNYLLGIISCLIGILLVSSCQPDELVLPKMEERYINYIVSYPQKDTFFSATYDDGLIRKIKWSQDTTVFFYEGDRPIYALEYDISQESVDSIALYYNAENNEQLDYLISYDLQSTGLELVEFRFEFSYDEEGQIISIYEPFYPEDDRNEGNYYTFTWEEGNVVGYTRQRLENQGNDTSAIRTYIVEYDDKPNLWRNSWEKVPWSFFERYRDLRCLSVNNMSTRNIVEFNWEIWYDYQYGLGDFPMRYRVGESDFDDIYFNRIVYIEK